MIDDIDLLERVLVLYELDQFAAASHTAGDAPRPALPLETARR